MARKEKTIHYIYKTTCLVTGRYYIGMHSTNNLNDGYMGSGKRLRRSLRKHGKTNHVKEILNFVDTRELLIEAEIKAITPEMIDDPNCMNLMGGGKGGYISEEQQRYRSVCASKARLKKLKNDSEYAKKVTDVASKVMKDNHENGKIKYDTFSGKQHSNETRNQISNTKRGTGTGETNSQYGTCWITKNCVNKKIKKDKLAEYLNDGWEKGRK
jgi:hypothetical protein